MHDHQSAALEREGELSAGLTDKVLAFAARLFDGREAEVRRVIDLGCGPGVGIVSLARAFPDAKIVAVDNSPRMPGAMKAEMYLEMLAEAGLHILVDRSLTRAVPAPSDPLTDRFIAGVLSRSVTSLEGFAAEDDLRAVRALVDEALS